MTDKTIEALKLAEEALRMIATYQEEDNQCDNGYGAAYVASEALAAIREALAAQDKQEPVAWVNAERNTITWEKIYPNMEPLYAAPVSAEAIRAEECERICAAIKAEDDYCIDNGDYMLDSNDCIKVARGEWVRPEFDPPLFMPRCALPYGITRAEVLPSASRSAKCWAWGSTIT